MGLGNFIALFASFPTFPSFSCPFFSHFSFLSFSHSLLLLSCYDFDVILMILKFPSAHKKFINILYLVLENLSTYCIIQRNFREFIVRRFFMKNLIRKSVRLKTKSISMRINNYYRFRRPQGMSATILQWFALDLEPPQRGRVRCNTTSGEKPFYNLLNLVSRKQ